MVYFVINYNTNLHNDDLSYFSFSKNSLLDSLQVAELRWPPELSGEFWFTVQKPGIKELFLK